MLYQPNDMWVYYIMVFKLQRYQKKLIDNWTIYYTTVFKNIKRN